MVEFACELLVLFYLEGAAVGSPGGPEEGYGVGDELLWDADGQLAEVKDES